MSLRDLKQTDDRMVIEVRQRATHWHDDLEELKQSIDDMYAYRNNQKKDTHVQGYQVENVCYEHLYRSFDDYQRANGVSYSLSIGDVNDALDNMASCWCNARQIGNCDCVAREQMNYCLCNVRNPIKCACVVRAGAKYRPICDCNCRYEAHCICHNRSQDITCRCNGRCSCNVVNEYKMKEARPQGNCECVSRQTGDPCACHARQKPDRTFPYCNCQTRNGYVGCACHSRWTGGLWDRDVNVTMSNPCECNSRVNNCANEEYCVCVNRAAGHDCCDVNKGTPVTPLSDEYCVCVSRTRTVSCESHVVPPA